MGRFRPLNIPPPGILAAIRAVEPSTASGLDHHPCRVITRDSRVLDRVLFVREAHGLEGRELPFDQILGVTESPYRLPARLADTLYRAGESGMGYVVYQMLIDEGPKRGLVTTHSGNVVDFPGLPPRVLGRQIQDVYPHAGRSDPAPIPAPEFLICSFWDRPHI